LDGSLRRWLFLSILSVLSIIDMLLSFQLLTETIENCKLVLAFLILSTTLLVYIVLTTNRNIILESLDTSSLHGWLIICLTITFLFIITDFVTVSFNLLHPMIADTFFFFTIILNSITVFLVLDVVIDVRMKQWSVHQKGKQLEKYLESKAHIKNRSTFSIEFESITRKFVGPSAQTRPCPHCLSAIDFNEAIEWLGPTSLICNQCGKIVDIVDLLGDS
jgi:hypothetical protein